MSAETSPSAAPVHAGRAGFIPGIVDLSVTDYCNADCGFCGFAKSKMKGKPRNFVDADGFARALPILHRRGIRFINFQGGEPLLHPQMLRMIRDARAAGLKPSLITNGWKLPEAARPMAQAGLQNLLVSIDSHDLDAHEENRGLRGLRDRVSRGIEAIKAEGVPVVASVTVSKLVRFDRLPETLRALGFDAVTFSYPRKEAFGSSSLVYDEQSDLVDFSGSELVGALDALLDLKKSFPVLNPTASIHDIRRHIVGERERFACVGGFKYFYLDWHLDLWRCEAWHEPMGSVFEFDHLADMREPCTACTMSCYRDTSTLMHAGVAVADAAAALAHASPIDAAKTLLTRGVAESLMATAREAGLIAKLGRRRPVRLAQAA